MFRVVSLVAKPLAAAVESVLATVRVVQCKFGDTSCDTSA